MSFEQFDHTADIGLDVFGRSPDELFVEALEGFADCVTELARLESRSSCRFELEAESLDLLMVAWLEELLYCFEVEGLLFRRAEVAIRGDGPYHLEATAWGEGYDPDRHPIKVLVKGVTYHGLEVGPGESGWRARVIFDI